MEAREIAELSRARRLLVPRQMKTSMIAMAIALAFGAAACGKGEKSAAAKFCLGADGTSQDCGISCKIDKDADTCAKWAEMTKQLCGKITKEQCNEICTKDENPTACELVKTMK
jgi:hypothetical protein